MSTHVFGGKFFRVDDAGRLHQVGPGTPDVTISRRLEDFPSGVQPQGSTVIRCHLCSRRMAWDGKFPEQPHICLQCAGIQPLPIEEGS